MAKIPKKIETYEEGNPPAKSTLDDDGVTFEPEDGQPIQVLYWVQYPSYDLIFGVPLPENPYSKTEVGYFHVRDSRTEKIKSGYYLDCNEAEEFLQGFKKIVEVGKLISPELWNKHKINKAKSPQTEMPLPRSNTQKDTRKQKK